MVRVEWTVSLNNGVGPYCSFYVFNQPRHIDYKIAAYHSAILGALSWFFMA